jgi:hypothetical protein
MDQIGMIRSREEEEIRRWFARIGTDLDSVRGTNSRAMGRERGMNETIDRGWTIVVTTRKRTMVPVIWRNNYATSYHGNGGCLTEQDVT